MRKERRMRRRKGDREMRKERRMENRRGMALKMLTILTSLLETRNTTLSEI